ncbi:hypothetical protein JMJ35_007064 [Cladonia borealis]|uniref:Methyltransferase domain-containing protein n=1 Tax=Cladonia borealis TaxID=184061 RepID=A0AA39QWN9_9LECA|nr:hypothetical protein JMJ35_007064 [Cladonia borealis]
MLQECPLPLQENTADTDYVDSLLSFITSSDLFQRLCGGIHILDFLTQEPDLYNAVLPQAWIKWFRLAEISDILDFFLREDITVIETLIALNNDSSREQNDSLPTWHGLPCPPSSLLNYVHAIRRHALLRNFKGRIQRRTSNLSASQGTLPRHVAVGMKPKKIHEVENFVQYIDNLMADIDKSITQPISYVVDFGSGQNYLGRALASPPHNKRVIAVESKEHNIKGAKNMDITAKLVEKQKIIRNKKQFRMGFQTGDSLQPLDGTPGTAGSTLYIRPKHQSTIVAPKVDSEDGNIRYVETCIENGDLSTVIGQIQPVHSPKNSTLPSEPGLMVISLHSCGNLIHHGLRSLILNPSVKAVAMIGCCYNLVTERLGPPTFKLPSLRSSNLRLDQTSSACDPHGFPMSERFATYKHPHGEGIRFNITARMMACQAPDNWTAIDCESFFTRHFYRALLQRIFLDRGIVEKPTDATNTAGGSPRGWTGAGPSLTIGSLRKACYASFTAYVRGAIAKLAEDRDHGAKITEHMKGLTNEEIKLYEEKYKYKKKELSIIWSLMAFSASVVESTIVVDRWMWLKEQEEVEDCWVEAVFDYKQSPRNLVVVGIKKS